MTQKQFPTEMKTFYVPIKNLTDKELHDCMIEEASEVIKALCKAERFGVWSSVHVLAFEKDKAPDYNNARDILGEFDQLHELVDEFKKRLGITAPPISNTVLVMRETI